MKIYEHSDSADAGVMKKARLLLGLNREDAYAMFSGSASGWPAPYEGRYRRSVRRSTQTKIALEYINECLKRGKVTW